MMYLASRDMMYKRKRLHYVFAASAANIEFWIYIII